MGDDDRSLALRAKKGDRDAVNTLLERHLSTVYRFVSVQLGGEHADLDDVVQETLLGASRSIEGLRGESRASVAAWLLSIARHKVVDHLRAQYRRPQESLRNTIVDPAPDVEHQVAELDRAERVRRALKQLTPEQEEILVLRFVLGFGIDEVAEITHRPAGAVKSMQHRALASLQHRLQVEVEAWT